jgi:hypothetical protein
MLHVLCNEVRGNPARVKKADLHHSSFTFVMQKRKNRKFASPVLNVLSMYMQFSLAACYFSPLTFK